MPTATPQIPKFLFFCVSTDKEFTSAMENLFLVSLAVAKVLRHAKLMLAAIKKDFDFAQEAMSLVGITYSGLEFARKTAWFKYV